VTQYKPFSDGIGGVIGANCEITDAVTAFVEPEDEQPATVVGDGLGLGMIVGEGLGDGETLGFTDGDGLGNGEPLIVGLGDGLGRTLGLGDGLGLADELGHGFGVGLLQLCPCILTDWVLTAHAVSVGFGLGTGVGVGFGVEHGHGTHLWCLLSHWYFTHGVGVGFGLCQSCVVVTLLEVTTLWGSVEVFEDDGGVI